MPRVCVGDEAEAREGGEEGNSDPAGKPSQQLLYGYWQEREEVFFCGVMHAWCLPSLDMWSAAMRPVGWFMCVLS